MTETASLRNASYRRLEGEVGALIGRVRHALAARAREVHPDLAPSAFLAVSHIDERGPVRASDLCHVLAVDKGAVSRQVTHLLELGLIDAAPDPDDGRATLLSITPAGHRRLAEMSEARSRAFDERMSSWPDHDLDQFIDLLGRYNATFTDRSG